MNNITVDCWKCHREFEVSVQSSKPVIIFKMDAGTTLERKEPGEGENEREIARPCPYCGETNMVPVEA